MSYCLIALFGIFGLDEKILNDQKKRLSEGLGMHI